jgi:hypothetical protein
MSTGLFTSNVVQNILAVVLFLIALFVSIRAFIVYAQTNSPRLFVLGTSMGIISLTAAADFFSSNVQGVTLNTDWFLYIGQAVSLLFILLSFVSNSDSYFQGLIRLQLLTSALLIGLLLFSPSLPDFPGAGLRALLSGSRALICFGIFFYYASAYMAKRTRFSLLMGLAFLFLAFGYTVLVQKYFVANGALFDHTGDVIRMIGLIALLMAVLGS